MNELIEVNVNIIGAEEVNSVNARDIHSYLEVKTRFNDWIQRAIKKYDFIEDADYLVLKNEYELKGQMRVSKEYIVTMDMAKELAMLENNKKGKEVRRYFIKMEKEALKKISHEPNQNDLMGVVLELVKTQQKQTDVMIDLVQEMKEQKQTAPQMLQPLYINGRARSKIREEIKHKAREIADEMGVGTNIVAPSLWIELKKHFDVDDYQDLLQSQLKEVLEFIESFDAKKEGIDATLKAASFYKMPEI